MINKEEYLNTVCSEIKFRAARKVLREELAAHIVDKKAELEKGGASDPEAQALVVMGDAKAVGRALNAVHRPRTEWGEIVCVLLLSAAGFIAFKAGSTYNPDEYSSMSDMLKSKFINNLLPGTVAGLSALVCSYFLDYKWLLRLRHVFFFAGLAYTSAYMMQTYEQGIIVSVGLLTQSGVIAISALFFLLGTIGFIEHSSRKGVKGMIGAAAACAVSIVVMYLLSFLYAFFLGAAYAVVFIASAYRKERLMLRKRAYIAIHAGIIVAVFVLCKLFLTTGWFTVGANLNTAYYKIDRVWEMLQNAPLIGSSPSYIQNRAWDLSASTTGYILTSVIGAYGWLVGGGLALTFAALLALMTVRSFRINHPYGRLLALAVSVFFCARFALFMLTNLGVIGGISVNLPFVSSGRFSYSADAFLVGVFLSVWRRSSFIQKEMSAPNKKSLVLKFW